MAEVYASILLERILHDALERSSSDIHLQMTDGNLQVEFRIRRRLVPFVSIPGHGEAVIRRVKALCKMDVSAARVPQDGSFRYESEAFVSDVRAACLPTISGESVVLRLLPVQPKDVSFASLGMPPDIVERVLQILRAPSGLVLIAGPTGAGKTTTMYAAMLQLARWGRRVLSIEDPVESRLAECQQMEVRERVGVTFESGLKAMLRQDPDVLMIGEIRDATTAQVVFRAALSGHVVLSTTHASDLIGAAARLADFGMSRLLFAEVVRGVVIQHMEQPLTLSRITAEWPPSELGEQAGEQRPSFAVYTMTPRLAQWLASDMSWSELRRHIGAISTDPDSEVRG